MPNLFSLLRGKRRCCALFATVLVCLDHDSSLVMSTPKELEALDPLHHSLIDVNGGVIGHPFPVVHNQLLCFADVEGEVVVLAPHCQVSDLLDIGCLIVVSDQAYHHRVICKPDRARPCSRG